MSGSLSNPATRENVRTYTDYEHIGRVMAARDRMGPEHIYNVLQRQKEKRDKMIKRWSGFDSQTEAWQNGYEWQNNRGPYTGLEFLDAANAHGYELDGEQWVEFDRGSDFAMDEESEEWFIGG